MDFEQLILFLNRINKHIRESSSQTGNTSFCLRNWFLGFYIVEFEQNGKDRAGYGKSSMSNIMALMKSMGMRNIDERELRRYRQLYINYPVAAHLINLNHQIRDMLPSELVFANRTIIRGLPITTLQIPLTHYLDLFHRISYSHFVELIRVEDPLKRLFYEIECVKGTWSVKELKRQIGSLLYERTGLFENKEQLSALVNQTANSQTFPDITNDPYIFEVLGPRKQEVLPEKALERALLEHLSQFLLELGKGFCFEASQKRIAIDNEHYFIDLVFYHRVLHCNVLIELKTERFHHTHAGQLNWYLE